MDEDAKPIPPGRLLKVVLANEETGNVYGRGLDGQVTWFTINSGALPDKDDIILLMPERWERAPAELWAPTSRSIVVVRHLFDEEVLVEDSIQLRMLPRPEDLAIAVNNTVEVQDDRLVRIISTEPLRAREPQVEANDVLSTYRVGPSDRGPRFEDFGGYPHVLARARELIDTQMLRREQLAKIGAPPVKGVLFTGPPGTGKTHLARILANESKADFFLVSGPTIVSKWVGESEETLRRIFEAATASTTKSAIIFFDEIDSIAERRGGDTHEASRRLVAQMLTLMDGFDRAHSNVVVIAATNRPEVLDPALTRPGRFDWEIEFGLPDANDRYQILQVAAARLATTGPLPLYEVAELTEGWSAAELSSIWVEAALLTAAEARLAIAPEDVACAYERAARRPRQSSEVALA